MSTHEDLRYIALVEFSGSGYLGTSLQRIAEIAGLSKSSVLYHYASKEALLEAAIGPAIDRLSVILSSFESTGLTGASRTAFLEQFVDFLLQYRLEVHMFINQGQSLVDVPVIDRANAFVVRLTKFFAVNTESLEERMRFGIALGGAAYMLCTIQTLDLEIGTGDEIRAALVTIMGDILVPLRPRPQLG